MPELWDLYTKYREKAGLSHVRGEPIPDGLFHLVVHVWIRRADGRYLISQRAANRYSYPLMWECPGGSVLYGETSLEGALREVKEEVGVFLDPARGRRLITRLRHRIDGKDFRDIMDVWLFDYDGEADLREATTVEVAQIRWMTLDEIAVLHREGELVPTLAYCFNALEAPAPDYSAILGARVRGTIDRPLGSPHPRHPDIRYTVNYGYVDGVLAGDGSMQDAYVLGVDEPLTRFEGTVIAVLHRYDDVEDKWIVTPDGRRMSEGRILGEISFVEQFFHSLLYLTE